MHQPSEELRPDKAMLNIIIIQERRLESYGRIFFNLNKTRTQKRIKLCEIVIIIIGFRKITEQ